MAVSKEDSQADAAKLDVKSQVAQTLIAAMESGDTPWQKPWKSQAMRPTNPTTNNAYKGVNRILLALSGRSSNYWCTYQQAAAKGWQVKKGEKGTMIVKLVEFAPKERGQGDEAAAGEAGGARAAEEGQRKSVALKRYWVFNAEQIDGIPESQTATDLEFEPVAKAEAIMSALIEKTGLLVIHGGDQACYVPSLDEIRLPPERAFNSVYHLWTTTLHEAGHSTMHAKRLDRTEAYAKRWGDSAYALEELTVEIASAILACETGVPTNQSAAHVEHHASYLRSWIKVIQSDPMAIFTAAKNADRICDYMLSLEKQMVAMEPHTEWIEEYDNARSA